MLHPILNFADQLSMQNCKTAKLQNCKTAKLQNCKTAKLLSLCFFLLLNLLPFSMLNAQNGPCDCPDPNDATYIGSSGTTTYLSSLSFNGSFPTSCVAIAGTLIVDQTFSANNTTFVMQPAAKIVVEGMNIHLTISNSNFHSCQNMWQGIVIQNEASLLFDGNNIQDAQYAIRLHQNTSSRIVNNMFHKNWIGIFIDPNGGSVDVAKGLYNNHFTCGNDNLLPPYQGQFPIPGEKSLAGFYVLNTPYFTIGTPNDPTTVNYMDGLHNGIIALETTIGIYHQVIQNTIGFFWPQNTQNVQLLKGIGIYTRNCPQTRVKNCSISNISYGITTLQGTFKAIANNITAFRRGIMCLNKSNAIIIIADNNIELSYQTSPTVRIGILLYELPNLQSLYIQNNNIHMQNIQPLSINSGLGIWISNCFPNNDSNFGSISNNSISMDEGWYGIRLTNSSKMPATNNTIAFPMISPSDFVNGFSIENSTKCRIRDNTITAIYNPSDPNMARAGIVLFHSPASLLCCNQLDEVYRGIYIIGSCNNSRIATTQFYTHHYGLYYDQTAVTGIQDHTGNEWHEDCNDLDLRGNNISNNTFLVDPSQQPFDWSPPSAVIVVPGLAPNCTTWPTCGNEWPYPLLTVLDSTIASGNLGNLPYANYTQWMLEQELYRKLMENPDLVTGNGLIGNFKNQRDTQDIGLLYPVRLAVDTLWQYDPALAQQMDTLYNQITNMADQLDSLYSVFPGSNPTDSLAIIQQTDSLQSEMQPLHATWLTNDSTFVQNVLNNRLPQALSDNQNLNLSFQPAVNERDFNDYLLRYWQNGDSLSSSEINGLYVLAAQCYYIGGPAVLRARALYESIQDTLLNWSDIEICKTTKGRSDDNSRSNQKQQIKAYPNPAGTYLYLSLPDFFKYPQPVQYELKNLQGKTILQGSVTSTETSLNIQQLPNGFYFLQITDAEKQQIFHNKISIAH